LRQVRKPVNALYQTRCYRRSIARELETVLKLSQWGSDRVARLNWHEVWGRVTLPSIS
jgi:hypothetical protein